MPKIAATPIHPIRQRRQQQELSLRRLGRATGIDHRKIFLFEHGLRPSPMELRLLAAALRVPVDELSD